MDPEPRLNCPRCQRSLPFGHAGGNCAACLVAGALAGDLGDMEGNEATEEAPQELGNFEILGEIGRGGTGVVYRARQRGVNRIVALKTLHGAGLDRRAAFQRLQIEAEAVGRLEHPNIVPLYELGRHSGTHFLTLRYFEHGSLADLLKRRRFSPEEAAGLIRTAARAVHHAHQRGVLHRDLKPSNLLMDEQGQPHVADFGLAKLSDSDSSLTLSTSVLGTPAYMAPEQASGHAKEAGTPADIYALGAVLFELLTGRPPFVGTSALEILRQVADDDPPRPRSLNARLDADLEAICLHCLEKEPDRRFPTAAALADDLERWLNQEPISLRPITPGERLVRWARRRPLVAALAAGIVLVLLIGLGTTTWQWRRAEARRVVLEQKDYRASLVLAADRLNGGDYPEARRILLDLPEKFRGWEWGRLTAMAHRELLEATVLTNDWLKNWRSGLNLSISEDGRWIACWRLGRMEVIETATGRPVLALGSTNDWASHADSNPQGDLMAISGPGHGFSLWNTRTWKKVRDFGTNVPKASSVRFSPDGRLLLTTGATNRLDLWDAATGDHLRTVRDSGVALFYATFSTSGDRIIASRGGRGWIWDTQTGAILTEVPTTPSTPDFLEITSDARHLVTIETNGVAAAWEVGATQPFFQTPPEDGGIGWAGLNLSERRFATHRADSSQLKFWNLDTGMPLPASQANVREVALSEDGQSLLTAASDQRIQRWSWETGAPETDWGTGMNFAYTQMAPSRNGRFIAVLMAHLQSPPSLRLWALPPADRRIAPSFPITRAALSPDGRKVAAGHFADQLSLWDADSGRRTAYLIGHHRTVSSVAWTADSKTLFSASADHTIRRWNVAERRCELVLTNLGGPIWSVSISTNAGVVAAADFTGTVGLWQGDGTLIQLLKLGRSLAAPSAIVSPDGRWLVVLGFPSGQGIWEVSPTRQVLPFNIGPSAFEDLPVAAAFSPDGLRLATIAPSGQLILWDTHTWKPIQTVPTRSGATDLIFSHDGLRLFLAASQAALAIGDTSVAVHDGLTGERLVSFDKVPGWTSSLGLDRDGRRLMRSVQDVAPRGHGADVWDAFPWRDQDYPGNPDESLGSRILQFARNQERSRQQHLETADGGLPETWPPEPRSHWLPRDAATPTECVDLTPSYNGHLETGWLPQQEFDLHDNNFAQLPQGIVRLVGIPWDIRGVISTGKTESTPYLRWRSGRVVEGIPVERRCRRLHFLHAASGTPLIPSRVGKYRLHYDDGSSADLELELGMDIGEYSSNNPHHPLSRCDRGEIAWEGSNPVMAQNGYGIRLFHRAWDNPHPDKKIVSMDLIAEGPWVVPFLVALTVEP